LEEPTQILNELLKYAELEFALHMGKLYLKINPENEENIFRKLWRTNFSQVLEEHNYHNMKPNIECPHITLINSNIIEKAKDGFIKKYGNIDGLIEFKCFFEKFLSQSNMELKTQIEPIQFTNLGANFSEDYTPFEEVVVARLQSIAARDVLEQFIALIKDKVDVDLPIKAQSSFHLTIAVKYREPQEIPFKNINELINSLGVTAPWLFEFWNKFIDCSN